MDKMLLEELERSVLQEPRIKTPSNIFSLKQPSLSKGTGHIKVGLQMCDEAQPTFEYGLLNSGCSDNLVSVAMLQTLPNYNKLSVTPILNTVIETASNDDS